MIFIEVASENAHNVYLKLALSYLQCLHFSKALCEILHVEQGLDAIRKQHTNSKEEMEKLQKQLQVFTQTFENYSK